MPRLEDMPLERLQTYLHNAVKHLDSKPDEAAAVIRNVVSHMAARRELFPDKAHLLTTLGYNVQWRNWLARERQVLLAWLIDADLPPQIAKQLGPAHSTERIDYIGSTIEVWIRLFGRQPNMAEPVTRWRADIAFLKDCKNNPEQ